MVRNPVKKGQVVALAITRSVTYTFGSGRGTERETRYTLALVNGANREGEATSLQRRSGTILQYRRGDYQLDHVMTIGAERQKLARACFDRLTWETDEFKTPEELRQAILATEEKVP